MAVRRAADGRAGGGGAPRGGSIPARAARRRAPLRGRARGRARSAADVARALARIAGRSTDQLVNRSTGQLVGSAELLPRGSKSSRAHTDHEQTLARADLVKFSTGQIFNWSNFQLVKPINWSNADLHEHQAVVAGLEGAARHGGPGRPPAHSPSIPCLGCSRQQDRPGSMPSRQACLDDAVKAGLSCCVWKPAGELPPAGIAATTAQSSAL